MFGKDRMHGFSFSGDNSGAEIMLRGFARLPEDWGYDYVDNPAPSFYLAASARSRLSSWCNFPSRLELCPEAEGA